MILAALVFAGSVHAAGNDELWEVTTKLDMAGLPPGMGAQKMQVCQDKNPKNQKPPGKDAEKCKVTDQRQSGNTYTMTMTCPDGTAVFETTYNAAHTEYKGTMKSKMRQGEMTMSMTGRKIGTCDAQQANAARDAKVGAMKSQAEKAQADAAVHQKKAADTEMANCASAVETMEVRRLGTYAQCDQMKGMCDTMLKNEQTKPVATKCMASHAEYCKRYRTMDGFLKAKGDEAGAKSCNTTAAQQKAAHCPQAAKSENLDYLARFCPVEAKPVAQQHCAGREYTSRIRDKYTGFCTTYFASHSLEDEDKPRQRAAGTSTASQPAEKKDPKAAISDGVTQGVNKLKGLFGR
jgi:hypothetical protein